MVRLYPTFTPKYLHGKNVNKQSLTTSTSWRNLSAKMQAAAAAAAVPGDDIKPLPPPLRLPTNGGGKCRESRGRNEGYEELPCLLTSCFVEDSGDEQDGAAAGPFYFRIVHANQALMEYAHFLPSSTSAAMAADSENSADENSTTHSRLLRGHELHRFLRLRDYSSCYEGGEQLSYDRCDETEASKSVAANTAAADPPGGGGEPASGIAGLSSSSTVNVAPCSGQIQEGGRGLFSARASWEPSSSSKKSRAAASAPAGGGAAGSQSWDVGGAAASKGGASHTVASQEEDVHQHMFKALAQVCVSVCMCARLCVVLREVRIGAASFEGSHVRAGGKYYVALLFHSFSLHDVEVSSR